ncbi:MAG: hypothetical protein ACYTFG_22265, partial [Planctomycetota bacterium]
NLNLLRSVARRTGGLLHQASSEEGFDLGLLDLVLALAGSVQPATGPGAIEASAIASGAMTLVGDPLSERLPPGAEQLLLGRYDPASGLTVAAQGFEVRLKLPQAESSNTFVPRLWAQRRIEELMEEMQTPDIEEEVTAISKEFTVMSPYTTFLVLEKEEDYRKWGIDRGKRRKYWKPWNVEPKPLGDPPPAPKPLPRVAKADPLPEPENMPPALADLSHLALMFAGDVSGRILTTASAVLSLQIYYRYGRILEREGAQEQGNDTGARVAEAPAAEAEPDRRAPAPVDAAPRPSERDIFANEREIALDEAPSQDPIARAGEDAGWDPADPDKEYESFKGAEDTISDRPFEGRHWNSAIGIGGGAGGTFGGRFGGRRNLRAYGGGRSTQSSVLMGTNYMKIVFSESELPQRNTMEVALGLLSYLGSGHTHKHGKYKSTVKRLIRYLKDHMKSGGLVGGGPPGSEYLTHTLAAWALSEAYGLSNRSPILKGTAQQSLKALCGLQRASGGFGRSARSRSDAVATTFAVFALKSAKISRLSFPDAHFTRALTFYDSLSGSKPGVVGFQDRPKPDDPLHLPSIAGAMIGRIFSRGSEASHGTDVLAGAAILASHLPKWESVGQGMDMTYFYLGTLAMFQLGREHWKTWNPALKSALVPNQ